MIFDKLFNREQYVQSEEKNQVEIIAGRGSDTSGTFEESSPTWRFLENHIEERLETLRRKNDNPTLTIERTQAIRGAIKELKALLELPNQIKGNNNHNQGTPGKGLLNPTTRKTG